MTITANDSVQDLDRWIGRPIIIKYILNSIHEITVILPQNWLFYEFPELLKDSFIEPPKSIHIVSIELDVSKLN